MLLDCGCQGGPKFIGEGGSQRIRRELESARLGRKVTQKATRKACTEIDLLRTVGEKSGQNDVFLRRIVLQLSGRCE
jgi:hypothetical protein